MDFKEVKGLKSYSIIFLITLTFVLLVRTFFIQSYRVSSSEMETALLKGDRLLVDKTAYGIRVPATPLSIPFTFDRFLGLKSYTDLIHLKYRRMFYKKVERNDVVLFNYPLESEKPFDKRTLCLSRCVAIPGDTVAANRNDWFVNGKKYVPSPDFLQIFVYKKQDENTIKSVMAKFDIPFRHVSSDSSWEYVSLNNYELFILNQRLSDSPLNKLEDTISYKIVVPSRGMKVELTPFNITLYADIIMQESGGAITVDNHYLVKNEVRLETYEFKEDYYWFVSDNFAGAVDSRQFGFLSEKYIIGKASYIWFSSSGGQANRNRYFSKVK